MQKESTKPCTIIQGSDYVNPRDMDAFYDAATAYDWVRTGAANPDRAWNLKADVASSESSRDFARAVLGRWKINQDDDVRYADERAWVKDIFKAETTCWTEERDRYPGFAPRRSKPVRNEELQAGDTTELDSFLASFNK